MLTVNGKTYNVSGNVSIINNRVMVNGKDVTDLSNLNEVEARNIKITIEGDCGTINADCALSIAVKGSCKNVKTLSGDVTVYGNVKGDVETMSGNVDCVGSIHGNTKTMSGSIKSRSY